MGCENMKFLRSIILLNLCFTLSESGFEQTQPKRFHSGKFLEFTQVSTVEPAFDSFLPPQYYTIAFLRKLAQQRRTNVKNLY